MESCAEVRLTSPVRRTGHVPIRLEIGIGLAIILKQLHQIATLTPEGKQSTGMRNLLQLLMG